MGNRWRAGKAARGRLAAAAAAAAGVVGLTASPPKATGDPSQLEAGLTMITGARKPTGTEREESKQTVLGMLLAARWTSVRILGATRQRRTAPQASPDTND